MKKLRKPVLAGLVSLILAGCATQVKEPEIPSRRTNTFWYRNKIQPPIYCLDLGQNYENIDLYFPSN